MRKQTKEQFEMIHGLNDEQSRTAKACFDILFSGTYRGVASKEHGITEQTISRFIRENRYKHAERHRYNLAGIDSLVSDDL